MIKKHVLFLLCALSASSLAAPLSSKQSNVPTDKAASSTADTAQYQIQHLEPLSWWVGMEEPSLQLLVHGKNIGELTPSIVSNLRGSNSDNDVKLVDVQRVDSNNYLFIDLEIAKHAKPQTITINFSQGDKVVTSYPYQLAARQENHAASQSYSAKDAIYLITPDRFANGDPDNDSVTGLIEGDSRDKAGGRHGGDIQGIINHLDYIADMGFTQIWLNPVVENNQETYSYHGYSATDFYNIDARFGSNALYRELSAKAQERSIGIIIDVVLNHAGSGHWWHNDLPTKDWYNYQGQSYQGTNHKREALHDPYAAVSDKTVFSDGWFVPTMPDLNQRNPLMANYLIQNTIWWLEYANLSGIRVDTYSYPDKAFLTEWTRRVTNEYPNINIVGEEWTTNPAIVSYWQKGKQTHDGYQSYLPSVMDFPLQDALIKGLTNQENWNTGLNELYRMLANDFLYPAPENLVIFPDNHDMSRIYTQLNEDQALFNIAMVYLATTRGIPQFFYGTEILMSNPGTDDHGIIRTDFPGGWQGDKVNGFSNKGLSKAQKAAKHFMRTLLNWRKNTPAIHQGKLRHYGPENGVYVYFRYDDNEQYMIVINKNTQDTAISLERFDEMLSNANSLMPIALNASSLTKSQKANGDLVIPKKSAHVFKLN